MAIPSRVEAVAVLRALKPSDKLFNHCSIVGEVAAFPGRGHDPPRRGRRCTARRGGRVAA